MCFSEMMMSDLLKYFHVFFAVPFTLLTFSILYFCLSFLSLFMTSLAVDS